MKKEAAIVAITACVIIFALAYFVFDFNDTIHYYAQQPWRFLLVGFIGVAVGLVAFVYDRLFRRLSRRLKLCVLGSAASVLMVLTGCLLFAIFVLSSHIGYPEARRDFVLVALGCGANIFLLWLEFYQVFKRQSE